MTKFSCKEPGCKKEVVYERRTEPGVAKRIDVGPSLDGPFTAYLTCEDGHIHPYQVRAT